MLLLVAPRGRWSQVAGLVSVGWGLVVWVFGEAFGGLFAPGLTVLFGAPGAALFYVVAGGLLALPDRAWVGRQLGRVMTALAGHLPAGDGRAPGLARPGVLAGPLRRDNPGRWPRWSNQMAATPQPHCSGVAPSRRSARFAEAHGWVVNLVAVVVMAAIGVAFVSERQLRPAVIALIVFGLADWVLIEDFGVFGGTGTDPNSHDPPAAGGHGRLSGPGPGAGSRPDRQPRSAVSATDPDRGGEHGGRRGPRRPPTTVVGPSRPRLRRSAGGRALGAIAIVLVGAAPMVAASVNARCGHLAGRSSVDGAPVDVDGPAPQFHLVDQRGEAGVARPTSAATPWR